MIQIKRDGQWAEFFYRWNNGELPNDLCTLVRKGLWLPFKLTALGSLAGFLMMELVYGLAIFGQCMLFGWPIDPHSPLAFVALVVAMMFLSVLGAIGVGAIAFGIHCLFSASKRTETIIKVSMFVSAVYKGFKEKYCPTVTWR